MNTNTLFRIPLALSCLLFTTAASATPAEDKAAVAALDTEYQAAVFNMYSNQLRNIVTWPAVGNHDTAGSTAFSTNYPYFAMFTLPTNAEAGGVPSGLEHYYSFDHGPAHFVCLDSMTSDRATNGAMADWLRTDLLANTNRWLEGGLSVSIPPEMITAQNQSNTRK